jgi:uncharacterized membrane protein
MPSPSTDRTPVAAPAVPPWLKGVGVGLLAVVWAVAAHFASAHPGPSGWGAALALAPVVMACVLGLWSLPTRWLGALGLVALAGLLVGVWPWLTGRVALLFFVEQTGVYLLMAVVFGRTLRGPKESLVTQMARRVHGGVLSDKQFVYTRKVTLAWSVFFAAMALGSVLLFLLAPTPVWSVFANLLGGPLIGLMFVGEFVLRRLALPQEPRATMADAIRAWKTHNAEKAP